jgi:DNA-binding ferritin-like protein
MDYLRKSWPDDIVLVCDRMDAFLRHRLIERKIPFITPFNQAYLPNLGIDLREYYRSGATRPPTTDTLSPAAQVVFLHLLQSKSPEHTTSSLHEDLGYTIMTLNRALDTLSERGLVRVNAEKWKKIVGLSKSRPDSWTSAQAELMSPIKRTEYLDRRFIRTVASSERMLLSGISALATLTDIAETSDIYAIDTKTLTLLKEMKNFQNSRKYMPESIEVEVWSYDPRIIAHKASRIVDPLSLFLTLKESKDERIQAALENMMKEAQRAWNW